MSSAGISKTDDGGGLAGELAILRRRVDELALKVQTLERGRPAAPAEFEGETPGVAAPVGDSRGNLGDWLSRSSVLPRLAAVCFILVFALLLRTVTDNGYLDLTVGSLLGLAYVAILIGLGWHFYAGGRALAPIFAGCGFLLLFAILVESRNRFKTMAPAPVMLILLAALG
ncbi:MAG TPA: hypothetical protein VLA15_11030, partial [Desulfurivibrionaceae bacterium]|nr:hypothetical protein [Desulfurivibrionaceae bacterium]